MAAMEQCHPCHHNPSFFSPPRANTSTWCAWLSRGTPIHTHMSIFHDTARPVSDNDINLNAEICQLLFEQEDISHIHVSSSKQRFFSDWFFFFFLAWKTLRENYTCPADTKLHIGYDATTLKSEPTKPSCTETTQVKCFSLRGIWKVSVWMSEAFVILAACQDSTICPGVWATQWSWHFTFFPELIQQIFL